MASLSLQSTSCAGRCLRQATARQPHLSIAAAAVRQQRQHSLAVVAQAVGGQIDINHVYNSIGDSVLEPYVGPVKAVRLKVGLGLESSRSLQAGETLLLSTPLALVTHTAEELAGLPTPATATPPAAKAAANLQGVILGDDDTDDDEDDGFAGDESGYDEGGQQYEPTDADIDQLAEQLGSSSNARTKAWLQYLDDGSLDASQSSQLPDLLALAALASSSSSEAPSAAASQGSSSSSRQISDDTLLDITDLNAQVLVEDDALLGLRTAAAAAAAAGSGGSEGDSGAASGSEEPKTLVGIWPELNLLQHSCSPNTSIIAHKSAAVVTASRSVPKQAALSRNLLGAQLLAPLAERRTLLQEATGAKCMCLRCRDEERTNRNFQQLMAEIYEACVQQVGPDLEQAVEVDDEAAMEGLRDQLAAYCEVVDAAFSKFAVKQQTQIWLQASLFKLYELTAIAAAACGTVDARLLELLTALAAEVSPGSSEHIFWARQYRNEIASDEESYFDGALRQAEKVLLGAYQARYGKALSRGLVKQLDALAEPPELEVDFEYE